MVFHIIVTLHITTILTRRIFLELCLYLSILLLFFKKLVKVIITLKANHTAAIFMAITIILFMEGLILLKLLLSSAGLIQAFINLLLRVFQIAKIDHVVHVVHVVRAVHVL